MTVKKILVCGAGGTPATNFVRSLKEVKEEISLVGTDCDPFTLQRAETHESFLVPRATEPDYINMINQIVATHGIQFIHAQNDQEIEILSEKRDELNAHVFLPSRRTVAICLDKFHSSQIWQEAGIRTPETMIIHQPKDIERAFESLGPRLWLRNRKGAAGKGSYPTDNLEEAVFWLKLNRGWGHFTAAPCLTERSVTWMSLWQNGNLVVAQGRKRLYWELRDRALSGVTGITGAGETVANTHVDEIAQKAIKAIDRQPHGVFSVDMTYDHSGVPNPTEINIGRFFTTHYFFTKAGLNMPEIYIKIAYGEKPLLPIKKINPLPDGLIWIRGVDFEPILTTKENIAACVKDLEVRRKKVGGQ